MTLKTRKDVEVFVDCDTSRLYGTLEEAITYLKEVMATYPEASLYEKWYGYEDMSMVFRYTRKENDDEFELRLRQEKARESFQRKMAKEEKAKAERRKEWEKLNREFGRGY